MKTTALVHPLHGTHFVYDNHDLEMCLKNGWTIRPENWKAEKRAAENARRLEHLAAEKAKLEAEIAAATPKRGPGRPKAA